MCVQGVCAPQAPAPADDGSDRQVSLELQSGEGRLSIGRRQSTSNVAALREQVQSHVPSPYAAVGQAHSGDQHVPLLLVVELPQDDPGTGEHHL